MPDCFPLSRELDSPNLGAGIHIPGSGREAVFADLSTLLEPGAQDTIRVISKLCARDSCYRNTEIALSLSFWNGFRNPDFSRKGLFDRNFPIIFSGSGIGLCTFGTHAILQKERQHY
jgi:hypothetical protein